MTTPAILALERIAKAVGTRTDLSVTQICDDVLKRVKHFEAKTNAATRVQVNAVEELARARKQLVQAKEALEPLLKFVVATARLEGVILSQLPDDTMAFKFDNHKVTVGDIRRAQEVFGL